MKKLIITAIAVASMIGVGNAALFSSNFDGNTGAHIFAGNTDNVTGSSTVNVTDWVTDASVTSISGLTAISPPEGGGFAQTQGGGSTYAGPDNIYLSRNHNQGIGDHGFSLTFTIDASCDLATLTVLSGHTTNTGNQDQSYISDLNFSLSGGSLPTPATGVSTENYGDLPAYHTVEFPLTGTTLEAGTYTLEVYQNNNSDGSYAIYDGITLDVDDGQQPPAIGSFDASSTNVFAGAEITLSWTAFGADTVTLNPGFGDVTSTNQINTIVTADTTYELIAANANGSVTSTILVTVITTPPQLNSFAASQPFVLSGDTVTLSWNVDGASGISIDQGVGEVSGTNQVDVVVTAETIYTLTATNSYGVTNAPVTVSVVELSDAAVISINFDDGTRAIEGPLGAVVATNWNWADIGTVASPVTTSNLLLSTGVESTADLDLSNRNPSKPAGGWAGNGVVPGATGDLAKLFHYRNRDDGAIATVREIPFTTYDVYVYFNGAIYAGDTFDISLGGTTESVTSTGDASAFVEANSGNGYTGNYYVFKDVTGSSFTLTVGSDASGTSREYAYGMQIVNAGNVSDGPVTVSIAGPVSGGNDMVLSWFGVQNALYSVETNSNLIVENWQPFGDDVLGNDETITVTNTIGPDQTFYRVISK